MIVKILQNVSGWRQNAEKCWSVEPEHDSQGDEGADPQQEEEGPQEGEKEGHEEEGGDGGSNVMMKI